MLPAEALGANGHGNPHAICPGPTKGHAHCHALVVTDGHGNPLASTSPTGLPPGTIQSVYGFPTDTTTPPLPGAGKTIALVDAYDDPTAESDLNAFSGQYGLPACTTASGCFKKVDQTGGTSYPTSDQGWALEISLDIQWAHAIAPGATILLVEASSNSFSDLMAAEDYAKAHAQYVSNSWGAREFLGENSYDSNFVQSGVSFFVSAGDSGLPAEWPAASPNVIAVGGTTLHFSGGTFTGETGWSSGGGGCSAYETATAAQSSFSQYGQAGCGGSRATPDVSLDADPNSGVSVYDSTPYSGQSGWWTVGGTSASSPMWAAASADAGALVDSAYVYGSGITFRDITSGNNGAPCLVGYDLCSGRGSWLYSTVSQPALSFTTAPQTVTAGQPSSAMQVGLSAAQNSDASVTLTSTSGTGTFATNTSGPWTPTLSLTIPAGQMTSPGFYYKDSAAGNPTLTASATGITSGSQTETVKPAGPSTMTVKVTAGSVTLRRLTYRVPLTVSATDTSSGAPLGGATVTLNVYSGSTCTGIAAASGSGTTGTNGQAGFSFSTRQHGTWCAQATINASGYTTGSGQTTFRT